ncbi:MAG TPA: NAD(P)H-quinone oxidoreductase [Stellaceae bacterium]|nr:NAD(P)H-quinone oxidoreductase [Stellaceae bacterium]
MPVPDRMRFIDMTEKGGPEVMTVAEGPVPQPGEGEVLIRVAAAGVNRPDVLQRSGLYPPPPGASPVLGLEVSGTIASCGNGADRWKAGDEVCALVPGGGYAEYCVTPAAHCLPIPRGLSLIEAAGLPETFFTVWSNVFDRGRLAPGETFLVHGGTSGIGTTAIQLAREFGARVFATAGTPEKCAVCVELGAERAIDYRQEDFVAGIKEATGGRGADVILDMVGGPYVEKNLRALAVEGRLVQIAFLQGSKVTLDLVHLMMRRQTITGSTLRPRSVAEKAAIARALQEKVWPLIEGGKVRPVVDRTFPLAEAAEAHRLMESSRHVGKILLTAR